MVQTAPFLSVVIPLKNEEDNVAPLLDELCGVLDTLDSAYEVLVIDDGSTDSTWAKLQQKRSEHSVLRLVKLDCNHGQSTAFWAGLTRARGGVVVMMDGDMQNDPNDIPQLLARIREGADVCLTYRANRQDTRFKKFQSRIGNSVRNSVLKSDVRDTGSQLRAFRRTCLLDLPSFEGMHRFMGDLFRMRGFKVVQIPTNHRGRLTGVTKYGVGNRALRGLKDLLGVRWLTQRMIQYGTEHEDE